MPRMSILNAEEKQEFDFPPVFNSVQRKQYFDITPRIESILSKLQSPTNKVFYLIATGYFKATKRFFALPFHTSDIEFVTLKLSYVLERLECDNYDEGTFRRHQQLILEHLGYTKWDSTAKKMVAIEIRSMVRSQSRTKFIFRHVVDILERRRIEIPTSYAITELILKENKTHKERLTKTIETYLSPETFKFLDGLLEVDLSTPNSQLQKTRLALLKRISQSTKPSKIRSSVDDFCMLRELYRNVEKVINLLDLTPDGIRYYAEAVLKSQVFQVTQRGKDDRYLHLACFAAHQCFRLQDTLVDILLTTVQNTRGSCEREHKELYYDGRKERRQTVRRFLTRVDQGALTPIANIEQIIFNKMEANDKVEKIKDILALAKGKREQANETLEELREQLEHQTAAVEYYSALESRSLRLQNRVSEIVKVVEFNGIQSALLEAIDHYKSKDGIVTHTAPQDFLEADDQKALLNRDGKFRVSLYKAFLFMKIAHAVKAGALNLSLSYKYRSLDNYLIPKDAWTTNRKEYLERADLWKVSDCSMTLNTLSTVLHEHYVRTNTRIQNDENKYVRFHQDGRFHVITPKVEDDDIEQVSSLFPTGRYISLLEVLSTVDRLSGFINSFEPWHRKYARVRPPNKTFFAGIIGIGCFIGTRKMEKISAAINGAELETTVNTYFSLENIDAANDQVLKLMNELELPEIYRNQPGLLHTSSDGQRIEVSEDSLNTYYSYKYFGKNQGATACRFLDERQFEWYGDVFSSADKEAHYVIDGLMHNEVVKSDIHSTDTDGYSEVVFGVTHLLGFSFAPRLKNLKTKTIYSFHKYSRKDYQNQEFKILPAKYINEQLVSEHWDDILRFVATIKLKHATASQLFKRLNSYSKQHPLYAALKEFGRIPKSDFILRYIDRVDFRQAIEKQLNKGENSNKFSKAVSFGNNHEFIHGEKLQQQIAEGCKRLIKNSIVCWNYVYATQLVAREQDPERRQQLIELMKRGSMATLKHLNLHGEYDFSEQKMQDSVGLNTPKKRELNLN